MCNFKITAQEMSDFYADMAEMAGEAVAPTDWEIEEMARYYGEN